MVVKKFNILENDDVEIIEDGQVVRTISKDDVLEAAFQWYAAAGLPAAQCIATSDYFDIVEELLFSL